MTPPQSETLSFECELNLCCTAHTCLTSVTTSHQGRPGRAYSSALDKES